MPIYEYICPAGHIFETFQRVMEDREEKCEVCGALAKRRPARFSQPQKAGVYVFDRKHGFKDILHDPTISQRERDEAIREIASSMRQPQQL
jgi:putative FmdB family regulatory protein